MKYLGRYWGLVAAAFAVVLSAPAGATVWDWQFPTTGCNGTHSCSFDSGAGSTPVKTLTVYAFSTNHLETTDPQSSTPTGNWIKANLGNYSGEFGITNTLSDTNEGSSPEHAVDNNQVYDVMIFELPKGMDWDIEAFRLGWARENNAGLSADVQAWFGGSANQTIDFSQVCFSGCTNALLTKGGTMAGFENITSAMQGVNNAAACVGNTSCDNNVPEETTITFNQSNAGTQSGRYLIMTGALGHKLDAFKPEFIKADGKTVPLPGTLALLGLGLAGLVTFRPRRAQAA